jgi:hypothetical protein
MIPRPWLGACALVVIGCGSSTTKPPPASGTGGASLTGGVLGHGGSTAIATGGITATGGGTPTVGTGGANAIDGAVTNVIPPDRLIPWQGSVGVEGGIPNRTKQIDCTAAPYNVKPRTADSAKAIQACLDGIASGEVAYLPAGSYAVGSTISIPSNKTLRGAGPDATVLVFADINVDVRMAGGYTDGTRPGIAIASGYTKGSTQLSLADPSGFSVGGHVYVSELNDAAIPVVIKNDNGTCNWCGLYGQEGKRARLQLAKITAIAGNTISIDPPMYFTFSAANAPEALPAPKYVEFAGLESLTVQNDGTSYNSSRKPIELQGTANCWVKNVKVDKCGSRCIDLWFDVFRNEIRDSYLTNCFEQTDSDNCYGLQIDAGSGNLVENLIFDNTANGILLVSASGNAFGYNHTHGVHRLANLATWMWPDSWTHGGHSSFNLWEGNDMTALEWDYYWGGNSHNLAFRNRFHGMDATASYDLPNLQTVGAILTYPNNHFMTAVGNVLGTSGFHTQYEETVYGATSRPIWATIRSAFGTTSDRVFSTLLRHLNYDYFNNAAKACGDTGEPGCQGGDGSTALPSSYYLGQKPAFFGAAPWPPHGPDVAGVTNTIPAATCFENTTAKGIAWNASKCY